MPAKYRSVTEMLADRKNIPLNELPHQVREAFKLALSNDDDARALVRKPNRIVQRGYVYASTELKLLAAKYIKDDRFIKSLLSSLGNDEVAKQILKYVEALKRQAQGGHYDVPAAKAPRDALRTELMGARNPQVYKGAEGGPAFFHKTSASSIQRPVVDRHTRDFTIELISAGAGNRENILLDVTSPDLKRLYEAFVIDLDAHMSKEDVLFALAAHTKSIFKHKDVSVLERPNVTVPLSAFLMERRGVCRHHSLFNAYVLSRLAVDDCVPKSIREQFLGADIIHHRQNIGSGAHTWGVVKFKDGCVYNVDSLWRRGVFPLSKEDRQRQDTFYDTPGIGEFMAREHDCFGERHISDDSGGPAAVAPELKSESIQQQVLSDICRGIANGHVYYNPLLAGEFKLIQLPDKPAPIALAREIVDIYELAFNAQFQSLKDVKTALQEIKQLAAEMRQALCYKSRDLTLYDYIEHRENTLFAELKNDKEERYPKVSLLKYLCQGIESGVIDYNPDHAFIGGRLELPGQAPVIKALNVIELYDEANSALKGEESVDRAYDKVLDMIKENQSLFFNESQLLKDHMDEKIAEWSVTSSLRPS